MKFPQLPSNFILVSDRHFTLSCCEEEQLLQYSLKHTRLPKSHSTYFSFIMLSYFTLECSSLKIDRSLALHESDLGHQMPKVYADKLFVRKPRKPKEHQPVAHQIWDVVRANDKNAVLPMIPIPITWKLRCCTIPMMLDSEAAELNKEERHIWESYGGKFATTLGLSASKAIEAGKLKLKLGVKKLSMLSLNKQLQIPFLHKVVEWAFGLGLLKLVESLDHWFLLISCHFGEDSEAKSKRRSMLLLDSLKEANSKQLAPVIRRFIFDIFKTEERPEIPKSA
ncbi:Cysteine proteinases superfamily protein [Perilla frutescens var. hirtella]|nr:Cysteine proteinases superfamily protein [Perilla frutescens var. hirtella]